MIKNNEKLNDRKREKDTKFSTTNMEKKETERNESEKKILQNLIMKKNSNTHTNTQEGRNKK